MKQISASPSLMRHLAAIFYDLFLLLAIILVAASLFTIVIDIFAGQGVSGELLQQTVWKTLFQFYLFFVSGLFYSFFWVRGGQTLGMKVWKIRLVNFAGNNPSWSQAWRRLLLALPLNLLLGFGLISRMLDPEQLSLYDRLSETRLIND